MGRGISLTNGLCFAAVVLLSLVAAYEEHGVQGFVGKSVTLKCDLPRGDAASIEWRDLIHNSDRDPILIFDSENNPDRTVSADNPNSENFMVDEDYSLIISNLVINTGNEAIMPDYGKYICYSKVNASTTLEKHYLLTITAKPKCSGNVMLNLGDDSELMCVLEEMSVSMVPKFEWFANGEMIEKTHIKDQVDFTMAKSIFNLLDATWQNDKVKYTCRITFGDIIDECSQTMDVKYLVHSVEITPFQKEYEAGDKLKCTGHGNPSPKVMWNPPSSMGAEGSGSLELTIEEEWIGKMNTFQCTASNTLDGHAETKTTNITFGTKEAAKSSGGEAEPSSSACSQVITSQHHIGLLLGILTYLVFNELTRASLIYTLLPIILSKLICDGNTTAIIIGVVVALIVVIVIIVAVVCLKRRKKSAQKKPNGAKPVPTKEEEVKAMEDGKA